MTFYSHKCSNTKSDVIQHRAQSSALRSFDQALLFEGAMIHLNPPRSLGLRFPFRFGHLLEARRPVFRRAVYGADAKHFDFAESFKPNNRAIAAAQPGIRDRLQTASVNVDLPVRFQPGQKMPPQDAHQFQIFNRPIPIIETNKRRIQTTLESGKQHFREMVVYETNITLF
jgi:hypothetical protein